MKLDSVGVIGGGAWGTALAQTLRLAGRTVTLWAREPETIEDINLRHVNRTFLPGVSLDEGVVATGDLVQIARCDAILMVAPAQHVRAISRQLAPHVRDGHPLVLCAKGIEQATGKMMGEVIAETLPGVTPAVLSGPSFAADVARGLPAALTVACRNEALGKQLAEQFGYHQFRLYWSSDVVGVELGGALKNVLAIAAGIVAGKGLGASAHAGLVTRGFAEMRRLGEVLGARHRNADGTFGPRRSHSHMRQPAVAQHEPRPRARAGRKARNGARRAGFGCRRHLHRGSGRAACGPAQYRDADHGRGSRHSRGQATVDDAIAALMRRPFKAED